MQDAGDSAQTPEIPFRTTFADRMPSAQELANVLANLVPTGIPGVCARAAETIT
jgi:hypothetical protein